MHSLQLAEDSDAARWTGLHDPVVKWGLSLLHPLNDKLFRRQRYWGGLRSQEVGGWEGGGGGVCVCVCGGGGLAIPDTTLSPPEMILYCDGQRVSQFKCVISY